MAPRPLGLDARRAGRGWALAVIASLACPTRCAASSEPMPTEEQCPHCGHAEWSCTSPCSPLLGIEFNFSYEAHGCFEAIPGNDRTLFWDTDAYCIFPEAEEVLGLDCDTMEKYTMDSPYVLHMDRCSLSSSSTMTVLEECHWTCKGGRPVYRCVWTFDPEGTFDHDGVSTLEKCWLVETCTDNFRQKVQAVCRPMDLWTQAGLSEQENQNLQQQLALLGNSHTALAEELVAALTSAGLTEEQATAAWDKYHEAVEVLEDHAEALNEGGSLISDDGAKADTVLTTVVLYGVGYMQLVDDTEHTSASEEAVKGVIIEAAGGDFTTEDVMVEFSRGQTRDDSMLIEASLEAHGAFTATLVQFNLKRSETLGADILEALQALPGFVATGPVSVGAVQVEVLREEQEETVDLAEQIAQYREWVDAQQKELDEHREKTNILTIVVIVMGATIVCLSAVVVALCFARKRSERVHTPTESDRVVIGRPVGQENNAPASGAAYAGAGAKGGAAGAEPAGIVDAVPLRPPEKSGAGSGTGVKGLDV